MFPFNIKQQMGPQKIDMKALEVLVNQDLEADTFKVEQTIQIISRIIRENLHRGQGFFYLCPPFFKDEIKGHETRLVKSNSMKLLEKE